MSWETAFEDLMPSRVRVAPLVTLSTDGYGLPYYRDDWRLYQTTYTTAYSGLAATTYVAHLTPGKGNIRSPRGTEVLQAGTAWIRTLSTVGVSDRFDLPVSSGYESYQVLGVTNHNDEDGHHHSKVVFG